MLARVVAITGDDVQAILALLHIDDVCDVVIKPVSLPKIVRAVLRCLEKSPQYALQ